MQQETVVIRGIEFFGSAGDAMLSSVDGSIAISRDEGGKFVSFSIFNKSINVFEEFLAGFEIRILGISNMTGEPIGHKFGSIRGIHEIEKLFLSLEETDSTDLASGEICFKNLKELSVRGFPPRLPPPVSSFPKLCRLTFEPSTPEALAWLEGCAHVLDAIIYHFPKPALGALAGLKSLRRLCVVQGKLASLAGIETLEGLEILHIVACSKLTDVDAVLRSDSIRHVMFEKYKKIKNWEFLAQKVDLETVWLEAAESIAFIRAMPNLTYFFCRTIIDRDRTPLNDRGFQELSPTPQVIYAFLC